MIVGKRWPGVVPLALASVVVLTLVVGWHWLEAQTAAKVEPEALLPPTTSVYARMEGWEKTRVALEKTTAFDAAKRSGLTDLFTVLLTRGKEEILRNARVPEEAAAAVAVLQRFAEHVIQHGVVMGADVQLTTPEIVVVFPAVAKTDLAKDLSMRLREFAELSGLPVSNENWDGRLVRSARIALANISWWIEGPDFVLCVTTSDARETVRRAAGRGKGLAGSPLAARFTPITTTHQFGRFWLDAEALFKLLPKLAPVPEILRITGVEAIQGLQISSGVEGKEIRTDVVLTTKAERVGLLSLLDYPAIPLNKLPRLPADCDLVLVAAMDGEKLYDTVVGTIEKLAETFDPDAVERLRKDIERTHRAVGFHMRDEMVKHLGPAVMLYQSPLDGPLGVGGVSLVIGVKNATVLRATLDKITAKIRKEEPKILVDEKDLEGAHLWIYGAREEGFPLAPTFALTDNMLVVSPWSPAAVTRFLRLQKNTSAAWRPPAAFANEIKNARGQITLAGYIDPRSAARSLVTLLPLGLNMARNTLPQLKMDLTQTPNLEILLEAIGPTTLLATIDGPRFHLCVREIVPLSGLGSSGAVGAAMVLPAIQQAREAARRAHNTNNLRQLGLGLHIYADTHKTFPRGTAVLAEKLPVEKRLSWMAAVLPFLEQNPLHDKLNFRAAWDAPGNKDVTLLAIAPFRSPRQATKMNNVTHYVGIAGVGKDAPRLKNHDRKAGIFGYDRECKFTDITDGTSNTIMVMEVNRDHGPWAQGGYSTIRGLTAKPYIQGPDGFSSGPEGVQVLMADGSVRLIANTVDPMVMEALVTKSGGEAVNVP